MSATAILEDLARLGLHVESNGDKLRVWPKTSLTDDIRRMIRDRRSEVLAALKSQRCESMAVTACPTCGGGHFWTERGASVWHCSTCYPAMPEGATTLTLTWLAREVAA